jgi:hypothetical protein
MTDNDFETTARCVKRYEQLRKAVDTRQFTGRPGDGWTLSSVADLPQFYGGLRNKVMISSAEDGESFEVLVFNRAGRKLHSKTYKGIDAAFRNGEKLADVEYPEPAPKVEAAPVVDEPAKVEHRETTIRVAGTERVIRTEAGGKVRNVKQLEAAHMKALKAALVAARQAKLDEQYADMVADAQKPRDDTEGFPGSGERSRQRALTDAEIWRHKYGTAEQLKPVACNYVDARKGFPKVTFKPDIPEYLVKVAPDKYATVDAAKSMGAEESVDEILPGLTLRRYGKGWALFHLASADEDYPNGFNLGPVFKTQKRAREVTLTDLARIDFTRSGEALVADPETAAVVKFVKLREFVAASKRNAWAVDELREAEAAVSALADSVAA